MQNENNYGEPVVRPLVLRGTRAMERQHRGRIPTT